MGNTLKQQNFFNKEVIENERFQKFKVYNNNNDNINIFFPKISYDFIA